MLTNIYNKFRRITSSHLYFPEIDGIRFLAISLVILFHTHGYFIAKSAVFTDSPATYKWLNIFLESGGRGVELFFVLSGFILCLPFARQFINNDKPVLLKKYYVRRLTRLEPPYIIAITLIFLLHIIMHTSPPRDPSFSGWPASWLASLTYTHNFIYHHTPFLTVVAWSLEIEIQFYLLAPFLFRILKLNVYIRRIIFIAATILLVGCQSFYTPSFRNIYEYAQYFFAGILLADFYVSNTATSFFNKKWIPLLAAGLLAVICVWSPGDMAMRSANFFTFRLLFPALIALFYFIVLRNNIMKQIFSYKFIPIIGGMCYSIYLLHYTIISIFGKFTSRVHITHYYLPNLLLQIILLGIPVLALSAIFYYYVERPFMSNKWTDMLLKKNRQNAGEKPQAD